VELVCPVCGKTFYRWPVLIKQSKEQGYSIYCSRECAAANKKEIWPYHGADCYAYKMGKFCYRDMAIREYGTVCADCGWDGAEYPSLLRVHHKDFRPRDEEGANELENLVVLCIRCHQARHLAREDKLSGTSEGEQEQA
jgi:5-methylcytosine-specific restriction endonuclease McrA